MLIGQGHALNATEVPFGAVLLKRDAPENAALCATYLARFEPGGRLPNPYASDGQWVVSRAVYWWLDRPSAAGVARTCPTLLARHDYDRSRRLRERLGIQANATMLVTADFRQGAPRRLCAFNLDGRTAKQIAIIADLFADDLSQNIVRCSSANVKAALGRRGFSGWVEVVFEDMLGPKLERIVVGEA